MSRATWMSEIFFQIRERTMGDLVIPGAHNSGSFSSHLGPGVRNQGKTLREQLEDGIRYLDLEVTFNSDKAVGFKQDEYYFSHNTVSATDLLVWDHLDGVRQFATDNPREFFILHFRDLWGRITPGVLAAHRNIPMAASQRVALESRVRAALGSRIAASGHALDKLEDLDRNNTNIILMGFRNDDPTIREFWGEIKEGQTLADARKAL